MGIEIIVLAAVGLAILSVVLPTLWTRASPLPTSGAARATLLAMLPLTVDGPVYDLGSGWGGLARALARRYPRSPVIGFEVSPLPWAWSRLRQALRGSANLTFRFGDFHNADLSGAALVVCYLPGPAMEKLKPKLEAELKPGAMVASNTFAPRGWDPAEVRTAPDAHASQVYLYRVGD
jgi:trans-aconitate methyltransferase